MRWQVAATAVIVILLAIFPVSISKSNNGCSGGGCHFNYYQYISVIPERESYSVDINESFYLNITIKNDCNCKDDKYNWVNLTLTISTASEDIEISKKNATYSHFYPGSMTFQTLVKVKDIVLSTIDINVVAYNPHNNGSFGVTNIWLYDSASVAIKSLPEAEIIVIDPDDPIKGEEVFFEANDEYMGHPVEMWEWMSDIDGFLSSERSFKKYLSVGTHTISLRVRVSNVWSDYVFRTVKVYDFKAIIDEIRPAIAVSGEEIVFRGHGEGGSGEYIEYNWTSNIDGFLGNTSVLKINSSKLTKGRHTIYFSVKDKRGIWSEVTSASIKIIPPREFVATIVSIEPTPAKIGEEVYFIGNAYGGTGDIVRGLWNSSIDGVIGEGMEITCSTLSGGTHIITFTVMNEYGLWSEEDSQEITVLAPPVIIYKHPNETDITMYDYENLSFNVDATDVNDEILTYTWYVNGKKVFLGKKFLFDAQIFGAGSYNISVIVSDGTFTVEESWILDVYEVEMPTLRIEKSPHIDNITIYDDEELKLNIEYYLVFENGTVEIINASDEVLIFWKIEWDGKIDALSNITQYFFKKSPGAYEISVSVSLKYKNEILYEQIFWSVYVLSKAPTRKNSPPEVIFFVDRPVYVGEKTLFDASASWDSDNDNLTFTWDFGDGKIGYGETAWHEYDNPGEYTIILKVSDGNFEVEKSTQISVGHKEEKNDVKNGLGDVVVYGGIITTTLIVISAFIFFRRCDRV